jgi:CheY-like chemotaxis protein
MIRLLCIEDQPDIQTILKLTLEAAGRFEVHLADTGADGVADAADLKPDAILLDYSLPDMDAPAVLGLLRANGATAAIPVILLTAMTHALDLEDCKSRGVVDTLLKPFNPRTLGQQIETLLSKAG